MTFVLTAVLTALLSTAAGDEVVARVGDARIMRSDLEARMRDSDGNARVPPTAALSSLVDEMLLAQDAQQQGLERDPEFARLVLLGQSRIAARLLSQRDLAAKQEVPEATLRSIFHSTADSARINLLRFTTREDAAGVAERLAKGGDLFAEAQRSLDPAAARSVAHLIRAQLDPALAEVVFRASPGAIVGPVQLSLGWAVAKVEKVFIGDEDEYKAKRPSLVEYARTQIAEQGRRHLVERLQDRAVVDEKFLTSLGKHVEVAPEQLDHPVAVVAGHPIRYKDLIQKFRWIAGNGSGHFAGPSMKVQLVRRDVDELLLGITALEKEYTKAPEIVAARPALETKALAELASERVRHGVPRPSEEELRQLHRESKTAEPLEEVRYELLARLWVPRQAAKVRAHVASLRARTRIVVDEAALGRVAPTR